MKPKTTAKDAVKIASEYFQFVGNNYGIRLTPEEIELSDDSTQWKVILSYTENAYLGEQKKEYKVFKINATTGEVTSMKVYYPPA